MTRVTFLINVGPKFGQMLEIAGITTASQLHQLGSVDAFCRVRQGGVDAGLKLLWALEGAILGVPSTKVSWRRRQDLLQILNDRTQAVHSCK